MSDVEKVLLAEWSTIRPRRNAMTRALFPTGFPETVPALADQEMPCPRKMGATTEMNKRSRSEGYIVQMEERDKSRVLEVLSNVVSVMLISAMTISVSVQFDRNEEGVS